jgi:hypothetical protein
LLKIVGKGFDPLLSRQCPACFHYTNLQFMITWIPISLNIYFTFINDRCPQPMIKRESLRGIFALG